MKVGTLWIFLALAGCGGAEPTLLQRDASIEATLVDSYTEPTMERWCETPAGDSYYCVTRPWDFQSADGGVSRCEDARCNAGDVCAFRGDSGERGICK